MRLSKKYDDFENVTGGDDYIWKKYVSATMDWTLKIEVNGESCEKILKDVIFDHTDFGKDPNILSPFNSQTKLLKSLFKKKKGYFFVLWAFAVVIYFK